MQKARFSLWHLFAIISMIAVAFACFRINHPTFWVSFPIKLVGTAFLIGAGVIFWRRLGIR
jgi:hypothetical protein